MKIYLAAGRYFERQADARAEDRNFETIETPFGASPKSDFIDWMNNIYAGNHPADTIVDDGESYDDASPLLSAHVQREAERRAAQPVHQPRPPRNADEVEQWILDEATPAEVEQIFMRLGARFHEMRKDAQ